MDEKEWLACTDPEEMLEVLQDEASQRKLRLLACAFCRRLPGLLESQRDRDGLELTERDVDGLAREEDFATLPDGNWDIRWYRQDGWDALARAISYYWDSWSLHATTEQVQADRHLVRDVDLAVLVRDIFCNPFRPLPPIPASVLQWNQGLVRRLAEVAYQQRKLPSGQLDSLRLNVLADALEEAGADAELVEHLRGPGPHVRGCWCVDLLTGRE